MPHYGASIAEQLERRIVFSTPTLPTIPARTFSVVTYGAVADGTTDNTAAIQSAINAASAAGGGTVEFPAGSKPYESGPLTLASSIGVQIDTGATLQMLPYGTYPLASGASSYATLLQSTSIHDVAITGGGTIDGQGSAWWSAYSAGTLTAGRPALVGFSSCTNVLMSGITLTNAPNVHIGFAFINTNVTVNGITINTPNGTPNTDGIDLTGLHVLIENSSISDGDDNIALGGRGGGDYTITNCTFGTGHGLSIGSFTGGGLNGLTVTNCFWNGTNNGIQGKTNRTRGGLVQNLNYSNLVMQNVSSPILFDDYYFVKPHPDLTDPAQAVTSNTPYWNNISITDLNATGATYPIDLWGLPEAQINTVTLSGVTSTGTGGTSNVINHATGVSIINSAFSPAYTSGDATITTTGGGPTVSQAASITSGSATSATLHVLGASTGGESNLTYTWIPVGRLPASVAFSANGTNAAKTTTATFSTTGTYVFLVVIKDATGLTTTSTVTVNVAAPTLTTIAVAPGNSILAPGGTQQLTATAYDQFGQILATQPTFTWSIQSGPGSVSSTGLYTAASTGGKAVVKVTSGTVSGTANVAVTIPAPSTSLDIGSPALAGSASSSAGTYTISGAGSDIYSTSDQFQYDYVNASGDLTIQARVVSLTNTNAWAKAGVMVRETTAANSKEVTMLMTPTTGNGASLQWRSSTGGSTSFVTSAGVAPPYWIRLVRSGSTFTGFQSPDGVTWTQVGSAQTVSMNSAVTVGLAVTSHNTSAAAQGVFDHVTIAPGTPPSIATAASASSTSTTAASVNLSVLGADDAGESGLTYTWTSTGPAVVSFSLNGTNAAKNTTATFTKTGTYTFLATVTDAFGLSTGSSITVTVDPPTWLGSGSVASWNPSARTLTVTGATSIVSDPGADEPIIQAATSAAVITMNPTGGSQLRVGGISLTNGAKLTVASLGAAHTSTNYRLLIVGVPGSNIAPTFTVDSTSTLDLADNDMAVLYGTGSSPLTPIRNDLAAAFDGGKWDKPGLTSSVAAGTQSLYGLGYGEASTLGLSTFDGLTLGGNAVLVKYTLTGDTNLSGNVDLSDYTKIVVNLGSSGGWTEGDFAYDGNVDLSDYTIAIRHLGLNGGNI